MADTIIIRYSDTPSNTPTLVAGEIAINRADGKLYWKDSSNVLRSMLLGNAIAAVLTGFSAGSGTVAATDTLLQAINKIVGNIALKANSGANTDITSILLNQTGLVVKGGSANALTIKPNETLSAARTLNIVTGDASRSLTLSADANIGGTNSGDQTLSDATISTTDVTTNNVTSTKHGFAPKSPADATKFLNGAATPVFELVKDSDLSTTDVTTNNFTTAKHGFVPKGTNVGSFLKDDGTWGTPSGGSSALSFNAQTGTSYTLVVGDVNTDVSMSNAAASTVSLPQNSAAAIPIGSQGIITWLDTAAGQPTIAAGTGATVIFPSGFSGSLRAQGSQAVWEKTATNTFKVTGDLQSANYVVKFLSSDATANSTTTGVSVTGVETTLDVGTYLITAWIRYVSSATTNGVKFGYDHSGTVTMFMAQLRYAGTGGTGATGAATMTAASATGNIYEAFSTRTKGTLMGPTISIDTTGDSMMIMEVMMTVSGIGTGKLMHASEGAVSSTVKSATTIIIQRVQQ